MSPKTERVRAWGDEPLRFDAKQLARIQRRIATTRPVPPDAVDDDVPERFVPADGFASWIRDTFIDPTGPLANERHQHLLDAKIGVLWTNAINQTKQRMVLATAEIPQTMGGAWKRARGEQQMRDWFDFAPDFVLTFYAPEVRLLDDRGFCALVEHECLHCAQALDAFGAPKFHQATGAPIFALRGHDVGEFTDVVERYGITTPELARMVKAANRGPLIGDGPIDIACGVCAARAA